ARAAGLDGKEVQAVVSAGVGSSRVFEIRGGKITRGEFDPGVRLELALKDVHLIRAFAAGLGASTPLLDMALPFYEKSVAMGMGDLDPSALIQVLERSE